MGVEHQVKFFLPSLSPVVLHEVAKMFYISTSRVIALNMFNGDFGNMARSTPYRKVSITSLQLAMFSCSSQLPTVQHSVLFKVFSIFLERLSEPHYTEAGSRLATQVLQAVEEHIQFSNSEKNDLHAVKTIALGNM